MKLIILTGYSGSGKSSALRYVEERGYYCVDNLPGQLLGDFVTIAERGRIEKAAVVVDARGREFMRGLENQIESVRKRHSVRIVFVESNLADITKRFQEHRLRHPLALKGTIRQGFETEKKLLASLRQKADLVLDTSGLNVHALKDLIRKYITGERGGFAVHLLSFGFKYGPPQEADVVVDVRLLANPYFEPRLKRKNGRNPDVQKFILRDKATGVFLKKTEAYLAYLVEKYARKSRPFVTVAFGCTGGKHRSVFVAERMKRVLQARDNKIILRHRDIALD